MRFYDTWTFKEIPQELLAGKCLRIARELGGTALGDLTSSNLWVT